MRGRIEGRINSIFNIMYYYWMIIPGCPVIVMIIMNIIILKNIYNFLLLLHYEYLE